jgi:hypothetical protein
MRFALSVAAVLAGLISPVLAAQDDIHYACDLSADEESAEVYSPGKGRAEFALERETLKLSWKVTYEDMSGPALSVGVYGPDRPGGNAGLLINLVEKGAPKSPVVGSKILNDGELQYFVTGRVYMNILSAKYKDGELRCQITRLREKAAGTTPKASQ